MKFRALNKKIHFENLKKEEFCFAAKDLKIFVKENDIKTSRLGISISSKQSNAVGRNKFKRRTREAIRGFKENKNLDILVLGNKESSNLSSIIRSLLAFVDLGGGNCIYFPSCTTSITEKLENDGIFKTIPLILHRMLTCNPVYRKIGKNWQY